MPSSSSRALTGRAHGTQVVRGAIAAGHPLTAAIGRTILEEGGNAADAAVAMAFAQGVTDPAKCGIGGWGVAVCRRPDGETLAIDFPAVAGSRARPGQWAGLVLSPAHHGYLPVLRGNVNDVGYGSIGVPSAVAGFAEIVRRFGSGRLGWDRLLEPAIRYARDGVVVVEGVLGAGRPEWDWPGSVPLEKRLRASPGAAEAYLDGGRILEVGSVLRQPRLAATLEVLAADGPDSFYRGELATRIAHDLEGHDATVTGSDLATYRPRVAAAMPVPFHGLTLHGTWPPESGVSIAQASIILEHWLDAAGSLLETPNVEYLVRALAFVGSERAAYLGDARFVDVDIEAMLDRAREAAASPPSLPTIASRSPDVAADGGHTTSVVVVDAAGGAVAMNYSIASSGGSGVVSEDLGFLYNNSMAGFDAEAGRRNSIAPGKARWSAACPTIVTDADGATRLAATGPGGSRAAAAVLQVILHALAFGVAATDAVSMSRVDVRGGEVDVEPDFPELSRAALASDGWAIHDLPGRDVAAVYAVERDRHGGLQAAADPRWPGGVEAG